MKISELSEYQRGFFAMLLYHKTECSFVKSMRIAHLEKQYNDIEICDVFILEGITEPLAKEYDQEVMNCEYDKP